MSKFLTTHCCTVRKSWSQSAIGGLTDLVLLNVSQVRKNLSIGLSLIRSSNGVQGWYTIQCAYSEGEAVLSQVRKD